MYGHHVCKWNDSLRQAYKESNLLCTTRLRECLVVTCNNGFDSDSLKDTLSDKLYIWRRRKVTISLER